MDRPRADRPVAKTAYMPNPRSKREAMKTDGDIRDFRRLRSDSTQPPSAVVSSRRSLPPVPLPDNAPAPDADPRTIQEYIRAQGVWYTSAMPAGLLCVHPNGQQRALLVLPFGTYPRPDLTALGDNEIMEENLPTLSRTLLQCWPTSPLVRPHQPPARTGTQQRRLLNVVRNIEL